MNADACLNTPYDTRRRWIEGGILGGVITLSLLCCAAVVFKQVPRQFSVEVHLLSLPILLPQAVLMFSLNCWAPWARISAMLISYGVYLWMIWQTFRRSEYYLLGICLFPVICFGLIPLAVQLRR